MNYKMMKLRRDEKGESTARLHSLVPRPFFPIGKKMKKKRSEDEAIGCINHLVPNIITKHSKFPC